MPCHRTVHRNGKVSPICPNLGLCILDVIKLTSLLTPLLADRVQFQPHGYVHPAGVNFCPPRVTAGSGARQSGRKQPDPAAHLRRSRDCGHRGKGCQTCGGARSTPSLKRPYMDASRQMTCFDDQVLGQTQVLKTRCAHGAPTKPRKQRIASSTSIVSGSAVSRASFIAVHLAPDL